jgi:hypothetical protein
MASTYPATLDSLATTHADGTGEVIHAATVNDLADATNKVEAELGTNPRGNFTTLRERLEARDLKDSCKLSSTANVTSTGTTATTITTGAASLTLDGTAVANGDRIFLKDQTTASQNGIYTISGVGTNVVLTRPTDADTAVKLSDSLIVTVEQGATNADTIWELITNNPITVGTTALQFTRTHPNYTNASKLVGVDPFAPTNAILESYPRTMAPSLSAIGTGALASGTVKIFPLGVLRAGQTATAINFVMSAVAATITGAWAGIARQSDRLVLARSNNIGAVAGSANVMPGQTFTFASTYTPDRDEWLYGFVMWQATTVPNYYGVTQSNVVIFSSPAIAGSSSTAQTAAAPPTAGTTTLAAITAAATVPYAYLT